MTLCVSFYKTGPHKTGVKGMKGKANEIDILVWDFYSWWIKIRKHQKPKKCLLRRMWKEKACRRVEELLEKEGMSLKFKEKRKIPENSQFGCHQCPFIRLFWCIHQALCILATGNLAGLAAAWQQATWQKWTMVTSAIRLLERGCINQAVPGLALMALSGT